MVTKHGVGLVLEVRVLEPGDLAWLPNTIIKPENIMYKKYITIVLD